MTYALIMLTRNGSSTVQLALDSVLAQTQQPAYVCVVNDGSTDSTAKILDRFCREDRARFHVVNLPDRGYDIRRVPANLNRAYAYLEAINAAYDYSLISGDDCIFPPDYCELLLAEMNKDPRLVIASGDHGGPPPLGRSKVSTGTGRMVRETFWRELGRRYPTGYGWEPWLLFKARQHGYETRNFTEIRYRHLRRSGSQHDFAYWGAGMKAFHLHPMLVFAILAENLMSGRVLLRGNLRILFSYLVASRDKGDAYFSSYDDDLCAFVDQHLRRRLIDAIKAIVS
jgi:glycosyltransferase involved in cell wall biosynthesis